MCHLPFDCHAVATMEVTQSDVHEVGSLNSQTLSHAVSQYAKLSDFLGADIRMCFHSTYVSEPERDVTYRFDTDGLVELKRAMALLALPHCQVNILQDCYNFLKKHVDLTQCTPQASSALRHSCGYTIGHVDGGYQLRLIFTPVSLTDPDTCLTKMSLFGIYACEMFNCIVFEFQKELMITKGKDKSKPTLQKQILTNTSRCHVLRGDLIFILSLVDKAIRNIGESHLLKPALFLTMFSQKDEDPVDMTDLVDLNGVASLSVHVA